jgi:ParB family chromosome partitioning protein
VLFDLGDGFFLDQRTDDRALVEAVADLHRRDFFRQALREAIVNSALHVNAIGAHAGLAGVAILGGDRTVDRRFEVRVVEYDERRVAAELQRYFFHRAGAL